MKACCINCFTNPFIQAHICSFNQIGNCDFCGSSSVSVASTRDVGIFVRDAIARSYEPHELPRPSFSFGFSVSQYTVLGMLRDMERVLSDAVLGRNDPNCLIGLDYQFAGWHFVNELVEASAGHPSLQDDPFFEKKAYTEFRLKPETGVHGADKYTIAWESFRQQAKHFARFFEMPGQNRAALLAEIAPWLRKLECELPQGFKMWRCRILAGYASEDKVEVAKKMGPAPIQSVKNNRMSPAGVSYTYLAEDDETAIAEIRPNVGNHVWSCMFELKVPLKVVDLTNVWAFQAPSIFDPNFTPDMKRVPDFLKAFAEEISRPVSQDASIIEYVPSQMVCEYIRSLGYHGVCFQSSLFGFKNLKLGQRKKNFVLFCGPEPDPTHQVALPTFSEWLDLKHWQGKTVTGVKYETYLPMGAHGGGAYRSF